MKIEIYQLKEPTVYNNKDYSFAKENGFSEDDYELVYEAERRDDYSTDDCLDEFTQAPPKNYKGEPLCTSDIIKLGDDKYYIDTFNFSRL